MFFVTMKYDILMLDCFYKTCRRGIRMRLKKWKSFLSIFMASALMMSTAAYGNPVVITPLEESQVASFQSGSPSQGQGPDGSSGTGSVGGGADSAGVVSSTGPSADHTNNINNPSSPSGPSQTADGTAAGPDGTGSSTGVNPGKRHRGKSRE